mgnify:CR=1 FL=1
MWHRITALILVVTAIAVLCALWSPAACTRQVPPRWRLSVFVIYRNEGDVLDEWLDHVVAEGVSGINFT